MPRGWVTFADTPGTPRVEVEIAETHAARERGLMYRTAMPEDRGMLFIYPEPHQAGFWMKNTHIPLSIGFFNEQGVLLEIHDMQPLDETTTRSRSLRVKYALEVNQGWFQRHRVAPGTRVEMPRIPVN